VGNKVALALLALAASVVVSACGGSVEAGDVAGTTPTAATQPVRQPRSDPHKSCDAQGINSTQMGIGACTEDGLQYVVANYGGIVKLRTLAVAVVGVGVAPADQGNGRTVRPQYDAFLRVTLQVQNRDKVAHRFALGQTMLGIAEHSFLERTDVERSVHQGSLATTNGGSIGPGETLRGDVVFDITEADYEQLKLRGRFFIWNFGRHATVNIPRAVGQLGQIRLYAVEPS
jgi:Domain of unknown function (DUF4352)